MKIAFTTLACPDWTLEQAFAAARDYGYDGIELRLLDGAVITPAHSETLRARLRAMPDALPVICLDSSVSLAQPDPVARAAQIEAGRAMIDLAVTVGAPYLRVFGAPPAGLPEAEALAAARLTMAALAEYGAARGVCVLLETHDAFCHSADVATVIAGAPEAGAGALWDLLHPNRVGEPVAATLATLGPRIKHVHIKDGTRTPDGSPNWPLVLLGEGDVPTASILSELRAHGYQGWISVEWEKKWHPHLAAPEIALPQHIAALRAMGA